MRTMKFALIFLMALTLAAPAMAYTIYLKDGSKILAKEKYEVVDGKALIVLKNGTHAFYDASRIDVARTETANLNSYGNAVVVEQGRIVPLSKKAAAAERKEPTLSDLIKQRRAGIRREKTPESVQEEAEAAVPTAPTTTATGAALFADLPRKAHRDLEVVSEIQQYFRSQGAGEAAVFRGTRSSRPLVEVSTDSEATVFRTLTVACNALLEIQARHGRALTGFDLLLLGAQNSRAGQFSLTPEMAKELVEKRIEAPRFFVKYVDF